MCSSIRQIPRSTKYRLHFSADCEKTSTQPLGQIPGCAACAELQIPANVCIYRDKNYDATHTQHIHHVFWIFGRDWLNSCIRNKPIFLATNAFVASRNKCVELLCDWFAHSVHSFVWLLLAAHEAVRAFLNLDWVVFSEKQMSSLIPPWVVLTNSYSE